VITRWGTWLNAVFYYGENFTKIESFINELDSKTAAISKVKSILKDHQIKSKLLDLMDYKFLPEAIKKLEKSGLKAKGQLKILEVKGKLKGNALQKLDKSLNKNPDLYSFTGENDSFEHLLKTKYAPLVSVDVERSFQPTNLYYEIIGIPLLKKHLKCIMLSISTLS